MDGRGQSLFNQSQQKGTLMNKFYSKLKDVLKQEKLKEEKEN